MRYLIPFALLLVALLCVPFAPSSPPVSHDADAAIALALATFRPCEVQSEPVAPDPWEQQAAEMMTEFNAHLDAVLKEVRDIEAARAAKEKDAEDDGYFDAEIVQAPKKASVVEIPPCGCGCMQGKGCLCENCCKRTADPQWKADHVGDVNKMAGGWHTDYELAFAESQSTGLPLFVDVRTSSCPYCDLLDRELATTDLSGYVRLRMTPTPYQASLLGVDRYPTVIVIRNGMFSARHVGYEPGAVRSLLHRLIHPFSASFAASAPASAPVLIPTVAYRGPYSAPACRSCGH